MPFFQHSKAYARIGTDDRRSDRGEISLQEGMITTASQTGADYTFALSNSISHNLHLSAVRLAPTTLLAGQEWSLCD